MTITSFSPKQRVVLNWWCAGSPHRDRDAIICDGAVRSGKTMCLGLSFFCWAMATFRGKQFALCGTTVNAVRRNLLSGVLPRLEELGFKVEEKRSANQLTVTFGGRQNVFYLYGGRNEGSPGLIQGITLAGVLLDEVALMPRSFVEQACARCSVAGSRLWFSCNPEGPEHWFYREWIRSPGGKNALYLHFTMADNPALEEKTRRRYERMFQGVFYQRFVLGEWVAAQGLVYDFFHSGCLQPAPEGEMEAWRISCDYGTANPASFGLWGRKEGVWYRVEEYYYDSRAEGRQKTDGEYADDLARLAGGRPIQWIVVDPSAASFITELRRRGWQVRGADNQVLSGIRTTAQLLRQGKLVICRGCDAAAREFGLYCWENPGNGRDKVRKEHDHAMDDIRYFAAAVAREEGRGGAFARSVDRQAF